MSDLPEKWTRAPIGALCDLKNGMAFKPTDWKRSGMKIVRIQNLNNPDAAFNYFDGEIRDRFIINTDDLLFAWSGTPGTSFGAHIWRGERAVLNQHIFRVDFDESVLVKRFFQLAINQKLNELIDKAHGGAGLQHVTKGRFEDTLIELPPFREQHRIVAKIEELFSELDKAVENLTLARAQLKTYRQALLKAAVEGRLTADWRAANPDKLEPPETLLARIHSEREARYNRALDEWHTALAEWRAGGEVGRKPAKPHRPVEITLGRSPNHEIATPSGWIWCRVDGLLREPLSNGRSVKDRAGGFPVLRLTAFKNGSLDLNESKEGAWTREEASDWIVREGDFFAARGNGSKHLVGIGALAKGVDLEVAYPDTMIRIAIDDQIVDPDYFEFVWNSRVLRLQIEAATRTTAGIYKINQQQIEGFDFPVPPKNEQREILSFIAPVLSAVDYQDHEAEAGLIRISALRQSILKQAFSGRLVPQDPADEPAASLLARLREHSSPARTRRRKTA